MFKDGFTGLRGTMVGNIWSLTRKVFAHGLCLLVVLLFAVNAQAENTEIHPPDVYQLVTVVHDEIEQLRWIMGSPVNQQKMPDVDNVFPHEVFFQAMTLLEKANRLYFEHTGEIGVFPETPSGDISPGDVYAVVKAALKRIRALNGAYGSTQFAKYPARDGSRIPRDVFQAVVQANRQLNLMLERQFAPTDVFWQVTVAASYAASILDTYPNPAPPMESPKRVLGKRPVDVFERLLETYTLIRQLGEKLGLKMLRLNAWTDMSEQVRPSDVFDVASLLVSELAYIHKHRSGAIAQRTVLRSPGKIPSDVYQRVELLNLLLAELIARNQ